MIKKHEDLLQWFDKDQIYEFHGGEMQYSYDPFEMWGLSKEEDGEEGKEKGGVNMAEMK